jgi:hypothetical protein
MKTRYVLTAALAIGVLAGCSRTIKVAVPPAVDLATYSTIGLVTFDCSDDADFQRMSTQRVLEAIQAAQPGTRIVELGPASRVLRSVDRKGWNVATYREIGERHSVDAILVGDVYLAQRRPDVELSTAWKAISVSTDVEATLSVKLMETSSGATLWADSARGVANVAHGHLMNRAGGGFSVKDPDEVYSAMIDDLAWQVTDDFRTHYVTRRVSKEEYERSVSADVD